MLDRQTGRYYASLYSVRRQSWLEWAYWKMISRLAIELESMSRRRPVQVCRSPMSVLCPCQFPTSMYGLTTSAGFARCASLARLGRRAGERALHSRDARSDLVLSSLWAPDAARRFLRPNRPLSRARRALSLQKADQRPGALQ